MGGKGGEKRKGEKRGVCTHKEIVCVRVVPAYPEELHQVVELTVDVATDCDGAFLLLVQYYSSLFTECMPTTGCTFDSSCRISRACVEENPSARTVHSAGVVSIVS